MLNEVLAKVEFLFNKFKKIEKKLDFPSEIEILGRKYEILVEFVKKKSSSVNVKENKLIFRLSSTMSSNEKQEHFATLFKKIVQKIEKKPLAYESFSFDKVFEKSEFYFANEKYFMEHTKNKGVKLKENTFFINVHTKLEAIEKYVIKLLCKKYLSRVKDYVDAINKQTYNYEIKDIELKVVNSKWGHCTRDNKLMFNLKLLNADVEIFNYVIIHELAHIKVKNHSEFFWVEVQKFCPNYKVLRKTLKEKSAQLFILN